jgi:hypothetical protein
VSDSQTLVAGNAGLRAERGKPMSGFELVSLAVVRGLRVPRAPVTRRRMTWRPCWIATTSQSAIPPRSHHWRLPPKT